MSNVQVDLTNNHDTDIIEGVDNSNPFHQRETRRRSSRGSSSSSKKNENDNENENENENSLSVRRRSSRLSVDYTEPVDLTQDDDQDDDSVMDVTEVKKKRKITKDEVKVEPKKEKEMVKVKVKSTSKRGARARKKGSIEASNHSIAKDREQSLLRQQNFIRSNWSAIKPFMEDGATMPQSNTVPMKNYDVLLEQPAFLSNVEMRHYQLDGVNWLIEAYANGISAILGDEMGLGKTLQTIAYLGWMKYTQKIKGPFLIVAPLSVIENWMNEFKRFLPQARILKLHTTDQEARAKIRTEVLPNLTDMYDVVVTTMEMVKNAMLTNALTQKIHWRCVVFDEGHMLRNENTDTARIARTMHTEQMLLLTGTPLNNNLHETWSLLNLLLPTIFQSPQKFDACFNITKKVSFVDQKLLLKASAMLAPFMLRRNKADVGNLLPKVEKKILCPLTEVQTFWYKRLLLKDSSLLLAMEGKIKDEKNSDAVANNPNQVTQTSWSKSLPPFVSSASKALSVHKDVEDKLTSICQGKGQNAYGFSWQYPPQLPSGWNLPDNEAQTSLQNMKRLIPPSWTTTLNYWGVGSTPPTYSTKDIPTITIGPAKAVDTNTKALMGAAKVGDMVEKQKPIPYSSIRYLPMMKPASRPLARVPVPVPVPPSPSLVVVVAKKAPPLAPPSLSLAPPSLSLAPRPLASATAPLVDTYAKAAKVAVAVVAAVAAAAVEEKEEEKMEEEEEKEGEKEEEEKKEKGGEGEAATTATTALEAVVGAANSSTGNTTSAEAAAEEHPAAAAAVTVATETTACSSSRSRSSNHQ